MTETERKALALMNEVKTDCKGRSLPDETLKAIYLWEALCRAIEQHEAFKQEVSDAVEGFWNYCRTTDTPFPSDLDRFIIAKPDPLVEALEDWINNREFGEGAASLRAAIEKRGGRIVFNEEQN